MTDSFERMVEDRLDHQADLLSPDLSRIETEVIRRARGRRRHRRMTAGALLASAGLTITVLALQIDRLSPDDGTPEFSSASGPAITLPTRWDQVPFMSVEGTLEERSDCLLVDSSVAVWPFGTTWNSGGAGTLRTEAGIEVTVGEAFSGAGAGYELGKDLEGVIGQDAYAAAEECAARTGVHTVLVVFPRNS